MRKNFAYRIKSKDLNKHDSQPLPHNVLFSVSVKLEFKNNKKAGSLGFDWQAFCGEAAMTVINTPIQTCCCEPQNKNPTPESHSFRWTRRCEQGVTIFLLIFSVSKRWMIKPSSDVLITVTRGINKSSSTKYDTKIHLLKQVWGCWCFSGKNRNS